jgi:hypothetical protein
VTKQFREFIIRETILAVLIILVGYFLFKGVLTDYFRPVIPVIFLAVYVITAVIHKFLLQAGTEDSQKFVRRFLMTSGAKMFLYLLIMIIYLFVNPDDAIIFLLSFLSFYLIFTVFEVVSILKVLKKNI